MTRRDQQPAQLGLFGRAEPQPPSRKPRAETNDLDLIASVIRQALEPGYVLIGAAERVYRRDPTTKDTVESVPTYEQDAVAQLLAGGHLSIGGIHRVQHGGREGAASSVLVPKTTRLMVTRWAALHPLGGRGRNGGTGAMPPPAAAVDSSTTEARRPR